MAKNKKEDEPRTAAEAHARAFKQADVDSPTVPGAVEKILREVDTIYHMHKRGKMDAGRYGAAIKYRAAYLVIHGSIGNAMDMGRVRARALPGSPPPPPWLDAAEILRKTKYKLPPLDNVIVQMICGLGYTVEQCSRMLAGARTLRGLKDRRRSEIIGERLRTSLYALAVMWGTMREDAEESKDAAAIIRTFRAHDAKPTGSDSETVPQARAVHATGNRIFRAKG